MYSTLIDRLPRIEGYLRVVLSQTETKNEILLKSGLSTHLDLNLQERFPLEALHLTQSLSEHSCVAHAIASVSALEDYLKIYPTETGLRIRQVLLDLSTIRSHIYHFYWEILPGYLNFEHYEQSSKNEPMFYFGQLRREKEKGDLDLETGKKLLSSISKAAKVIDLLQKSMTLFGGKYPVIMNQIPGGVSNFSLSRSLNMTVIRNLELCKSFIEETWPLDLKEFVQNIPNSTLVLETNPNLISFGSLPIEQNKGKTSNYSEGVLLKGKLEPVNELKITETLTDTYYLPTDKSDNNPQKLYALNKPGARTWIKGARYNEQTMITGALSRMMITHLVGGNLEISDIISQMIDDLELTFESPNCTASRLLSEVLEGRIYLKNIFKNLFEISGDSDTNRKTRFNFSPEGVGIGKIESPSGSLLHQVYISNSRIKKYVIISPMNWNFSPGDEEGKKGVVETELNQLTKARDLTPIMIARHLHSYNAQILDGTR
ncbi:nickel-dependent hydrogenase large subunit [bacterium]|nr:nickel-dependent hydrogenase large subunit [bacterium]